MQNAYEYKIGIELLFIVYKQVFDSIGRPKLIMVLSEMGIHSKLRTLINITMDGSDMKTQKGETEDFTRTKEVR